MSEEDPSYSPPLRLFFIITKERKETREYFINKKGGGGIYIYIGINKNRKFIQSTANGNYQWIPIDKQITRMHQSKELEKSTKKNIRKNKRSQRKLRATIQTLPPKHLLEFQNMDLFTI